MDRGPRVPESLIGRERRLELGSRRAVVGWFVTRRIAHSELPDEHDVAGPIGRPAEPDDAPSEVADPRLLLSGELAELLLDALDPAPGQRAEEGLRDGRHGRDPGRVDALDRAAVRVGRAEIDTSVDEVDRLVEFGRDPG